MKKTWALLLVLSFLAAIVVGCKPTTGPSAGMEQPTDEGVGILKNSSATAASIINPHEAGTTNDKEILGYTQGQLYRLFPDEEGMNAIIKGELAEGPPVQVDEGGRVWQIRVKENAKWENGEPLTADDFIYSWQMLLDPLLLNQYGGTFAESFIKISNALAYFRQASSGKSVDWSEVGIKQLDQHTIEIHTDERNTDWEVMNHFMQILASPVYKPLYEQWMNDDRTSTLYGTDAEKYMGCGAFILTDWVKESLQKYKKNPNYVFKDLIWLAGIETQIVKDAGTRLQMFERGDLHYVGLSAEALSKYKEDPRLGEEPSLTVRHIEINMNHPQQPILGNENFRKALYYAIDRDTYARVVMMKPAPYVMSSRKIADTTNGIPFRDLDIAKSYLPENNGYDKELAKQLFDLAMQEEGLDKVTLTLNYNETRPDTRVVSELMQKDLPAIFGEDRFELKLKQLPTSDQLFDAMRSYPNNPSTYELSWAGWGHSAAEFTPWKSFVVYTSTYDRKNAPIYDAELDALYAEVSGEEARFDLDKSIKLTAELERLVLEHVYEIPVYEQTNRTLISDRLELQTKRWMSSVGYGFRYAKIVE